MSHKQTFKVTTTNPAFSSEIQSAGRSLQYQRQRLIENFLIVWLDENMDENQTMMDCLLKVVNTVRKFVDWDACVDYITDIEKVKIFVIISCSFEEYILPVLNEFHPIDSIYILCRFRSKQEQKISNCEKVKGVFNDFLIICEHLLKAVRRVESDLISIDTQVSFDPTLNSISDNRIDPCFMYSQILKEILLEAGYHEAEAKSQFFELCRRTYLNNPHTLKIIDEFINNENNASAVWWYTSPNFLHEILNYGLRTQDLEIVIKMGFFIKNLHHNITELHSNFSLSIKTVYRGQA
jgi:hypothetical protein